MSVSPLLPGSGSHPPVSPEFSPERKISAPPPQPLDQTGEATDAVVRDKLPSTPPPTDTPLNAFGTNERLGFGVSPEQSAFTPQPNFNEPSATTQAVKEVPEQTTGADSSSTPPRDSSLPTENPLADPLLHPTPGATAALPVSRENSLEPLSLRPSMPFQAPGTASSWRNLGWSTAKTAGSYAKATATVGLSYLKTTAALGATVAAASQLMLRYNDCADLTANRTFTQCITNNMTDDLPW